MNRILLVASVVLSLWNPTPFGASRPAMAQDGTYSVSIRNGTQESILIRRMGRAAADVAEIQIDPNQPPATLDGIPSQSDQVLMAWSTDGSNRLIAIFKLTRAMAAQNNVSLSVMGQSFVPAQLPPGGRPPGNMNPQQDTFARNLGIFYVPLRLQNGTIHLRITRPLAADAPAAPLRFEVGDIITALDDQTFRNPQDVLSHFDETTVDYIDKNTGQPGRGVIQLPPQQ